MMASDEPPDTSDRVKADHCVKGIVPFCKERRELESL